MTILGDYLRAISGIRATRAGTAEISYYGALAAALNAVGATLKPRVMCVQNVHGEAGFPDFGLFVIERGQAPDGWRHGRPPERGVIEVDDIPAEIGVKRNSTQVAAYLANYGLVLVTNYRDFVLLGLDARGRPEAREQFGFGCKDASAFFALAARARKPDELDDRFTEFLTRVLLHQAPLTRPEDVAFFLASYARDARARLAARSSLPAFADLREALQDALGMQFDDTVGEHLFRSTLVQTLFYGLFSAWVEVASTGGVFEWRAAGWSLRVPFVDTLFQRIATPQHLRPLGLEEPLAWAAAALGRVDRAAFFARFEETDAVRYFYEPFLAAYDPVLRRQFGVWYTPREIVRYMVERVDHVLRTELGLADGFADENVWVLDPCCGTGAYLVEVLARIRRTLLARGEDALTAEDLKRAATTRIAGFEIMPSPYVIAHWQVGHALRAAGAPLAEGERAAIYLTNALTGWSAPSDGAADADHHGVRYSFPPLADERDEARRLKRERPILVVLGNPPYNAFAGTSPAEESGLVEPYKAGLQQEWGIRKFNLDDLYVRFFRIAERRIAEGTGRGVVCFITNHSWLWYPSFVVMRRRIVSGFDKIWIDELHGDRKSSERGPDGRTSETIFAMRGFSPGIVQGTAISLLVRKSERDPVAKVLYNDSANASSASERRQQLLDRVTVPDDQLHNQFANPTVADRYTFRPTAVSSDYSTWAALPKLAALAPFNGVLEKRRSSLMAFDRAILAERMTNYFDITMDYSELKVAGHGPVEDMAAFKAKGARDRILREEPMHDRAFRRLILRPFDSIWAYHTNVPPIWNRPRPELVARVFDGNAFLVTRLRARRPNEGEPVFWTPLLTDGNMIDLGARPIPVWASAGSANLSPAARAWLGALNLPEPDGDAATAYLPWHHALAIAYAPAWLAEHGPAIRQDWPRVPLPNDAALLQASAALGARVAALLDPDVPVTGVTAGELDGRLATIAVPARLGGGAMTEAERCVTAGWGHAGKDGAVMPARGRVPRRAYGPAEIGCAQAAALLGACTSDIFLNDTAYWRNVPDEVWGFAIGGYQVLKKWLSYRERPLFGRVLTPAEVRYFMSVARRLAALRLMAPELDANYRACAAAHRPLS